jgi:SAM-dependent methyltransferase
MSHKVRTCCAICGNEHLHTIMEYGDVPLAGDFPAKNELKNDKKYDLNIQFCPTCSLLQTDSVVDADVLFKDYRYMSSIGLTKHFTGVAQKIKDDFEPSRVLEIGSNDGVLLKPLNDLGINAIGVDPATNICRVAEANGCCVYNEYFSEEFVTNFEMEDSFDFAVCNNCFAHIDDIQSIVRGVKKALSKDGHFQVEVHYVKPLIDKLQYDNIYHEHIYYYSLTALNHLFSSNGMTIVDFEELPIHAGSIRILAKNCVETLNEKVLQRLDVEDNDWGITSLDYFTEFSDRARRHIKAIEETLQSLRSQGKKIVGYGASGRANMICNLAGIDPDIVEYIVDESPERMGRHIAGTHIPIVSKEHLDNDTHKPDYVIIFAWNFSKMIIDKLDGNGYRYIVAFPEIQIVDNYEELKGFVSI